MSARANLRTVRTVSFQLPAVPGLLPVLALPAGVGAGREDLLAAIRSEKVRESLRKTTPERPSTPPPLDEDSVEGMIVRSAALMRAKQDNSDDDDDSDSDDDDDDPGTSVSEPRTPPRSPGPPPGAPEPPSRPPTPRTRVMSQYLLAREMDKLKRRRQADALPAVLDPTPEASRDSTEDWLDLAQASMCGDRARRGQAGVG